MPGTSVDYQVNASRTFAGAGLAGPDGTVVAWISVDAGNALRRPGVQQRMVMAQPQLQRSQLSRRVRQCAIAALIASGPGVLAAQDNPLDSGAVVRDRRPFAALSATALSMRDSVVAVARSQIGTPYRFGGTTPSRGFDCSGFVRYVLSAIQLVLPRTAAQQAALGATVPKDTTRLRPGDLLTFGRGGRVTHIGIYVGNGRYVHASPTAGRVIETSLDRTDSPLVKIWRGGRRLLAEREWLSDTTVATH